MIIADVQNLVADEVRDQDGVLQPDDIIQAMNQALTQLSIDEPYEPVLDIQVNNAYNIPAPEGFDYDNSQVLSAEYPLDLWPHEFIGATPYRTPDGVILEFSLKANGIVRLTYTRAHALDVSDPSKTTITERQKAPLACYAAHILCGQLASYYAHNTDSLIAADSVEHQSQHQQFRTRANDLLKRYKSKIKMKEPSSLAAGASINWNRPTYGLHARRQ